MFPFSFPDCFFFGMTIPGCKGDGKRGSGQGVRVRGKGGSWGSMVDILCCMELLDS